MPWCFNAYSWHWIDNQHRSHCSQSLTKSQVCPLEEEWRVGNECNRLDKPRISPWGNRPLNSYSLTEILQNILKFNTSWADIKEEWLVVITAWHWIHMWVTRNLDTEFWSLTHAVTGLHSFLYSWVVFFSQSWKISSSYSMIAGTAKTSYWWICGALCPQSPSTELKFSNILYCFH